MSNTLYCTYNTPNITTPYSTLVNPDDEYMGGQDRTQEREKKRSLTTVSTYSSGMFFNDSRYSLLLLSIIHNYR